MELIGAATAEADAEVLALTIDALRSAGLIEFQLNVGHMGLFRALMTGAALPPGVPEAIRAALNRKDSQGLAEALAEAQVSGPLAEALQCLPTLCGGPEILDQAALLSDRPAARNAVERLRAIHHLLERRELAGHVIFDLSETRGMGYYTGIAFEGFAPGLGFPLCSGGRYDSLIAHYGPSCPAVGVALGTERVLLALGARVPARLAPDLLVAADVAENHWRQVEALRRRGWRVAADVLGHGDDQLRDAAIERSIPVVALAADGGQVRVWTPSGEHWLTWEALAESLP